MTSELLIWRNSCFISDVNASDAIVLRITAKKVYIENCAPILKGAYPKKWDHGSRNASEMKWIVSPEAINAKDGKYIED